MNCMDTLFSVHRKEVKLMEELKMLEEWLNTVIAYNKTLHGDAILSNNRQNISGCIYRSIAYYRVCNKIRTIRQSKKNLNSMEKLKIIEEWLKTVINANDALYKEAESVNNGLAMLGCAYRGVAYDLALNKIHDIQRAQKRGKI